VLPGTVFPPGFTDLQTWVRDEDLQPDWLRVGTDIVGGATPPTFSAAFSLSGVTVPGPVAAGSGADCLLRSPSRLVATAAENRLNIRATSHVVAAALAGLSPYWLPT
jgi:hypothetical protein